MYSIFIILNDPDDLPSLQGLSVISPKGLGKFTQSGGDLHRGVVKISFYFFQELVNIQTGSEGEMSDFWEGKSPCWTVLDCSKLLREKCPAFSFPAIPCWEVAYTQKEILLGIKRDCTSCKVYKLYKDVVSAAELDSSISSTGDSRKTG